MNQFRLQFSSEIQRLGWLLQPDETKLAREDWGGYAARCSALLNEPDLRLVRAVYLWLSDDNRNSQLLRLNRGTKSFEVVSWPSSFEPLRDRLVRPFSFLRVPALPRQAPAIRPSPWMFIHRIPLMIQPLVIFPTPLS
jgi:hypothetical protein